MTPQETDPDLPMSVQWRRGLVVAFCRLGALSAVVPAWDHLKEVAINPTIELLDPYTGLGK